MRASNQFVVATPGRSVCDDHARVLLHASALRFIALGTRRGTEGIPQTHTRLLPLFGLLAYAGAKMLSSRRGEAFRFSLLPMFDRWVKGKLQPGNHIISSYGYANDSFGWVRAHGGKTFLDGGNSHPDQYWTVVAEEHARWKCPLPPMPRCWHQRSVAMMPLVDYVISPSNYVTGSFLSRGFKPEQILRLPYPVNLEHFRPATTPRPSDRPLTIISTAGPSLRKGTPYLLEAYRALRRQHPSARLILNNVIHESMEPVLKQFVDLPIDWTPPLPHAQLAELLRNADIFVLPSVEEGLVRTALEAMACGLPVILTPNTGTADFVKPGINGEVVPVRDSRAILEGILKWADRLVAEHDRPAVQFDADLLSFGHFERSFLKQLQHVGLLDP